MAALDCGCFEEGSQVKATVATWLSENADLACLQSRCLLLKEDPVTINVTDNVLSKHFTSSDCPEEEKEATTYGTAEQRKARKEQYKVSIFF